MKIEWPVVWTILFAKIAVYLLIICAYILLPFGRLYYISNFIYPAHSPITWQTAFSTWDAQHYLYLADYGYKAGIDSNAFPPLFPLLIHFFSLATHNNFSAGLLVVTLFSTIGLYLFYAYVKKISTQQIAYRSLLCLLAFPTTFFFSLIYTEALFFLLVILFFIFLQKRQLVYASIIASLLPLTRLIGTAIVIPFLSSYVFEYLKHSVYDQVEDIVRSLTQIKTLLILSPLLGLALYLGFMNITTGSFFTPFTAQHQFISHYSFLSLFNPLIFLRTLFMFPLQLHGFTNSLLDRLFFIGFICFLPAVARRVSLSLFLYTLLFGLLSVLGGSFMSYMRYLVVVFPLFIAMGKMSLEKKYHYFSFVYLFLAILFQALFIIMHALNYWVA